MGSLKFFEIKLLFLLFIVLPVISRNYTRENFLNILKRKRIPNAEMIVHYHKGAFNTKFLNEINSYFDNLLKPSEHIFDDQLPRDYNDFCCACDKVPNVECPQCYNEQGQSWCRFNYFEGKWYEWQSYMQDIRRSIHHTEGLFIKSDRTYLYDGSFNYYDAGTRCVPFSQNFYMPSSLEDYRSRIDQCMYISRNGKCDEHTYVPPSSPCDYKNVKKISLVDSVLCYSPVKFTNVITLNFSESHPDHFCNDVLWEQKSDLTYEVLQKYKNPYHTPELSYLGVYKGNHYFNLPDHTPTYNFINAISNLMWLWLPQREISGYKVSTEDYIFNQIGGRERPVQFFDVFVPKPCDVTLRVEEDRSICRNDMKYRQPSIGYKNNLFNDNIEITVPVDSINIGKPFNNVTCTSFGKIGYCVFSRVLEEFETDLSRDFGKIILNAVDLLVSSVDSLNATLDTSNFYDILNRTLDAMVVNFANEFGKNVTKTYTIYNGTYGKPHTFILGNWFSGLFYDLIEPFFKIFIDLVLKSFLEPIMECVIEFLKLAADLIEKLSLELLKFVDELSKALSNLITNIVLFFVGLVVTLESHILLLEYTILFMVVLYFVINNWMFASVIVILAIMVFGIQRKSPSMILYFLNQHYLSVFNFSDYYAKEFLYDYSISYIQDSKVYTYHFHNHTVQSYKLY